MDQRGVAIEPHLSPDARNWYERHLARESELHEMILDSAYGQKMAVSGALAGTSIVVSGGAGLAVVLGGTALGAAVMYFGNTADAIKLGLIIAAAGIEQGIGISRQGYRQSTGRLKQDLDPAPRYRFVRYLPEYLWMGWSDQDITYPVELRTTSTGINIRKPGVVNRTSVSVAHMPDAQPPCSFQINNSRSPSWPCRMRQGIAPLIVRCSRTQVGAVQGGHFFVPAETAGTRKVSGVAYISGL